MHLRNQIKRWLCDQVVEVDAGSSSPGETVEDVEDTFNLFRLVDWFLTQSSGSLGICGSVAIPSCAAQRIFWPKLSTAAWHHSTAALLRSCFRDLASLRRTRDRSEKKKTQLSSTFAVKGGSMRYKICKSDSKVVHVKGWNEPRPIRVVLLFVPKQKMPEVERVYWVYISVCSL